MTQYIEYELKDGTKVWVEGDGASGVVRASGGEPTIKPSKMGFKQAFEGVKSSIKDVIEEFDNLHIYEAEIRFGLKSVGEAGIFAIGKVGGEMNYEVTLKWKKLRKKNTDANGK